MVFRLIRRFILSDDCRLAESDIGTSTLAFFQKKRASLRIKVKHFLKKNDGDYMALFFGQNVKGAAGSA